MDRCYESVKGNICRPVPIAGRANVEKGTSLLRPGRIPCSLVLSGSEFAVAVSGWPREEAGPVGPSQESVRKALRWYVSLQITERHLSGGGQETVTGPIRW